MKPFTNYRYYILMLLAAITLAGAFCAPSEELDILEWIVAFVAPRLVAFVSGFGFFKLWQKWEHEGTIPELSALAEDK